MREGVISDQPNHPLPSPPLKGEGAKDHHFGEKNYIPSQFSIGFRDRA